MSIWKVVTDISSSNDTEKLKYFEIGHISALKSEKKNNMKITDLDCRKADNKYKFQCKVKRFCNSQESSVSTIGKNIFSMMDPTVGAIVSSYDAGKSASCAAYKRLKIK